MRIIKRVPGLPHIGIGLEVSPQKTWAGVSYTFPFVGQLQVCSGWSIKPDDNGGIHLRILGFFTNVVFIRMPGVRAGSNCGSSHAGSR